MEELLEILKELKPGVEFLAGTGLAEDGVLDSIEIMELADELMERFEIELTPLDIIPENFQTVETLWNMVTRKQEED